jgi:hypothetical protein
MIAAQPVGFQRGVSRGQRTLRSSPVRRGVLVLGWILPSMACSLLATQAIGSEVPAISFPIVVRVSDQLFENPSNSIDRPTSIDVCVLGSRNRGQGRVVGQASARAIPADDAARILITFAGSSSATTTGNRRPVTICSQTTLRFNLRMLAEFSVREGFFAGSSQGTVCAVDAQRAIRTSVPGLRGRIVRRVARKRLRQQACQIEAISESNARRRLTSSMEAEVAKRIATLNESWFRLRDAVQQESWYPQLPKLHFNSGDGYLAAFVLPSESGDDQAPDPGDRPDELPSLPELPEGAVGEILVSRQWLTARADAEEILSYLAVLPEPLAAIFGEQSAVHVQTSSYDQWLSFWLEIDQLPSADTNRGK